jgi:aryl-alcohol dehydrogenase-like predicted oxidoreductase
VDALLTLAKQIGKMPAQVALNWLLQRQGVTSPIIGARTMEQLEANLGAVGWTLSREDMETLNQTSQLPPPYPYDFIARAAR